jgi:hypothetical protein
MNTFPIHQLPQESTSVSGKYWGIWLPVPTFIAVINSLFWIWLFSRTVGLAEPPETDARENEVIEQF